MYYSVVQPHHEKSKQLRANMEDMTWSNDDLVDVFLLHWRTWREADKKRRDSRYFPLLEDFDYFKELRPLAAEMFCHEILGNFEDSGLPDIDGLDRLLHILDDPHYPDDEVEALYSEIRDVFKGIRWDEQLHENPTPLFSWLIKRHRPLLLEPA